MRLALFSLFIAIPLLAQTPAPPALPTEHIDVIGTYNQSIAPGGAVSASYAHLLAPSAGTYSFSAVDVALGQPSPGSTGLKRVFSRAEVSTTSGLAQYIGTSLGMRVFAVGTAGVATTPGGGPSGFIAGGGFLAVKPLKKNWTLDFHVRALAGTGNPQYVFGIGFGYGK